MATDTNNLDGLFKEAYGDEVVNLIPQVSKIQKMVPFVPRDKETGNLFHNPVVLSNENSVTYALNSDGAFAIEDAIPMEMGDAQVQGTQMLIRGQLSYEAAAKASNDKKAFVKATSLIVENMVESLSKRVELSVLYGQSGLAKVASSTNQSATETRLTIKQSDWSAGIFAGLENSKVNFYNASSIVSSGADAVFTIDRIEPDSRYVYVTGTATGITALDSAVGSNPDTIDMFFKNAYGKEAAGIKKILTNSGTLFNISASDYSLWKANSVTESGTLTYAKLQKAIARAVVRGLDEDVTVLVNPKVWIDLANDMAALRKFDSSYSKKKAENGSEELVFYGPNGSIEIVSHILVKEGDCFAIPPKRCLRPGAIDISFERPGAEGKIFFDMPSYAGYEIRGYCNQAFLILTPARCVYISGFLPSS